MVFSDDFLHFLKIIKNLSNPPKLSCGFKFGFHDLFLLTLDSGQSKSAEIYSNRALSNLSAVNDIPGVWDIFITKQLEVSV